MPAPLAFTRIADLAKLRGVSNINALPGCWEVSVGPFGAGARDHRPRARRGKHAPC